MSHSHYMHGLYARAQATATGVQEENAFAGDSSSHMLFGPRVFFNGFKLRRKSVITYVTNSFVPEFYCKNYS